MANVKFSKKTSVKELLGSATGGLTFRKTFTPHPAPPMPVKVIQHQQQPSVQAVNEKKIFNRLCDLFGKDESDMNQVFEADPARAAADVLGYSYQTPASPQVQLVNNKMEEDDQQAEMKDRLMKEIKEKISERRRRILQQRRDLFESSQTDESTVQEDEENEEEERQRIEIIDGDLWKAVPALADPDADSSFEEERGRWDPDAAFSEVERILESLESNAALNEELVGRFRLDHCRQQGEDEDKHSDDSGMSSSADTSNSSTASSSSTNSHRQEVLVVKPVRKSKQLQQQQQNQQVAIINANEERRQDDNELTAELDSRNQINRTQSDFHIYAVAHDSPVIIDSDDLSERRIRLDLSVPTPTPSAAPCDQDDRASSSQGGGRRRSGTLTNSAGEMFGSLRSNLSAGAYSTGEALNRIAQHVSDNIVRPIAETMGEAGDGLVRAAEPLVQHLQLLSTRLQVRYMHAAQHKQWLPHFALMREASDWIEGIPKVRNKTIYHFLCRN